MADDVPPTELDQALATATHRTIEIQEHVGDVIDEGLIPPRPVLDDVVQRSEDVKDLAAELEDRRRPNE